MALYLCPISASVFVSLVPWCRIRHLARQVGGAISYVASTLAPTILIVHHILGDTAVLLGPSLYYLMWGWGQIRLILLLRCCPNNFLDRSRSTNNPLLDPCFVAAIGPAHHVRDPSNVFNAWGGSRQTPPRAPSFGTSHFHFPDIVGQIRVPSGWVAIFIF